MLCAALGFEKCTTCTAFPRPRSRVVWWQHPTLPTSSSGEIRLATRDHVFLRLRACCCDAVHLLYVCCATTVLKMKEYRRVGFETSFFATVAGSAAGVRNSLMLGLIISFQGMSGTTQHTCIKSLSWINTKSQISHLKSSSTSSS